LAQPWLQGVQGDEVVPIIESNERLLRVEAGPGTGKTFGLVRRVQRILHPDGLGVRGADVLVVAFNRVIAKALKTEIAAQLKSSGVALPTVSTVHALCHAVIGRPVRILLPHEHEAMVYDIRTAYPDIAEEYEDYYKTAQALVEHEAGHADHAKLWQAARQWLVRHRVELMSDLPGLVLARVKAGDFRMTTYQHVIVDEYQDLTPGEQLLFMRLRKKGGSLVALGDPRQSIYRFRGNDSEGLSKLEALRDRTDPEITDVPMTECRRCLAEVVKAANRLMTLSRARPMRPGSKAHADIHVLVWRTPRMEAAGMAQGIVRALQSRRDERHLVMVTRHDFGYWLRDHMLNLDPKLKVELNFSESLLETWPVREAFLFFCLIADPDPPTWRAWLGYSDAPTGKGFAAPERNSAAYLLFLTSSEDNITADAVRALADAKEKPPGRFGQNLWRRAKRFARLQRALPSDGIEPERFVQSVFAESPWLHKDNENPPPVRLDMATARTKALAILQDVRARHTNKPAAFYLNETAKALRYQIATREPFVPGEDVDIQVATLWGAKGVTADHVYILGLCDQAIPGKRRPEYPGTDLEYLEEQRRLFYVSITRARKTLILSRAERMRGTEAAQMGLYRNGNPPYEITLRSSQLLTDISPLLPDWEPGEEWLAQS
jgi:superfamily I DNA/RNA helicase